jgi:hypothetical protein
MPAPRDFATSAPCIMNAMGLLDEPSWSAIALAVVGWLVVGAVPGALVVAALDPWRPRAVRYAVAPLVSVALAFGAASFLQAIGVGWSPWQSVAVLTVASLVSGLVLARRRRAGDRAGRVSPADRRDLVVVLGSAAASTVVWVLGLAASRPAGTAVLPQADGVTHGLLTTRMLLLGTVDPYRLNVTDLVEPAYREVFYPVAFHVLAGTVTQISESASVLLVGATLVASAWSVLGVFALTRMLAGRRAARRAAVASALLVPGVLVGNLWWGSFTTMLATAAVPAALACLLSLGDRRGRLVGALAVSGLLCAHTTEALVVLGVCLLAFLLEPRARRRVQATVVDLAVVVAGAIVLSLPTVRLLLAPGGADRPQEPSTELGALEALLNGFFVPLLAVVPTVDLIGLVLVLAVAVVAGLAIAGAARLWRTGAGRALTVSSVGLLALSAAAYAVPIGLLGWPWYGNAGRMGTAAATFLPVLVGAGWLAADARAARAGGRRGARVLAAAVTATMALQSVLAVTTAVDAGSVVTPDARAAFEWLERRVQPGERVLNDWRDGSLWAYQATDGTVRTVFGAKPGGGFGADPEFTERVYLRDHVTEIATDARAQRAARDWQVRYVLVTEPAMQGGLLRMLGSEDLSAAPGVREVFRSGDAVVYELPRS